MIAGRRLAKTAPAGRALAEDEMDDEEPGLVENGDDGDREVRRVRAVAAGRLPVPADPEAGEREHERREAERPERAVSTIRPAKKPPTAPATLPRRSETRRASRAAGRARPRTRRPGRRSRPEPPPPRTAGRRSSRHPRDSPVGASSSRRAPRPPGAAEVGEGLYLHLEER